MEATCGEDCRRVTIALVILLLSVASIFSGVRNKSVSI